MPIEFVPHDGDIHYVVCHRVTELPIPFKPAKIVPCCSCGERIWRGDASPEKPPAICLQCMTEMVKPDDAVTLVVGQSTVHAIAEGKPNSLVRHMLDMSFKSERKP